MHHTNTQGLDVGWISSKRQNDAENLTLLNKSFDVIK